MKRGAEARDAPALPPCIWKVIFDEVARADAIYRAPLRLVCRDWRAWAAVDQKDVHHGRLLLRAAFDGHLGLCKLARSWMLSDYDELGVRYGTGQPPWWPITDEMAATGAINDHADVVGLAREWGARPHLAIMEAASRGNEEMCRKLKGWDMSKSEIESMLRHGFHGGHESVCRLAMEWGARNFVDMLEHVPLEIRQQCSDLARSLMRSTIPRVAKIFAECYPDEAQDDEASDEGRWPDDDNEDPDRVVESPPRAAVSRRSKSL